MAADRDHPGGADHPSHRDHADTAPLPRRPQGDAALGRELGGDLPCHFCGYNLKGISIRGVCPECGVGVRATILAVVDPMASELQPIHAPTLVATGLVAWAGAATGAAILWWLPQAAGLLDEIGLSAPAPRVALAIAVLLGVSGLGALVLIRPHGRTPWWYSLSSVLGIALYLPMIWGVSRLVTATHGAGGPAPVGWAPKPRETAAAVVAAVCVAGISLLLRPVVRLLVARSLVIRTGRVDRQTMYGMAAAAGVVAAGYLLGRAPAVVPVTIADPARLLGLVLVTAGSLLLTLGLVGSLVDAVRIARSILTPTPTLRQVIRSGAGDAGPDPSGRAAGGGGVEV